MTLYICVGMCTQTMRMWLLLLSQLGESRVLLSQQWLWVELDLALMLSHISRDKSRGRSDDQSSTLVGTHVEEPAIFTIMRIRWLRLLISCWLSCCGSWHLTFPLTPTSTSASKNILTLPSLSNSSSLTPMSSTCFFGQFLCVESRTSPFYPMMKLLTQRFCNLPENLKCWRGMKP